MWKEVLWSNETKFNFWTKCIPTVEQISKIQNIIYHFPFLSQHAPFILQYYYRMPKRLKALMNSDAKAPDWHYPNNLQLQS